MNLNPLPLIFLLFNLILSLKSEEVIDPNGYILYCPCMGMYSGVFTLVLFV